MTLEIDAKLVEPFAQRLVCMAGEMASRTQQRNLETIRGWSGVTFVNYPTGYTPQMWTDIVHDQADMVVETLVQQATRWEAKSVELGGQEGEVEGVTYRVAGSGPPLLLFPIGLCTGQWDAAMGELSKHFTTIRLGGEYVGMASQLEFRARSGTYIQGIRSMFDLFHIRADERVLEVGTGQGTLARDLAVRTPGLVEVVAVDINDYMLGEARNFASKASLSSPLRYDYGNAESLPFEAESFDVAFSVTVFEECDADKAIAELNRVLKPGGRAGVIIRSRDLPWYWNVDVSEEIKAKINVPDSEAGASPGGCVDSSLYPRFTRHFLSSTPNVYWNTMTDVMPPAIQRAKRGLSDEEARQFDEAATEGRAAGTLFAAMPLHCVVGTKAR